MIADIFPSKKGTQEIGNRTLKILFPRGLKKNTHGNRKMRVKNGW